MITGFVKGQSLKLVFPPVAADAVSYLTGKFIFQTADWCVPDMSIWAHFRKGETQIDAELHDGEFGTDAGVNLSEGEWEVWLTGHVLAENLVGEGDATAMRRITTTVAKIKVLPSGVIENEPLPTNSFGEAILAEVKGLYDDVGDMLRTAAGDMQDQLADQDERVEGQLADQNAAVADQLSTQDAAVESQLNAQDAAVDARLDANEALIDAAFGGLKNWCDGLWLKLWAGSEEDFAAVQTPAADTIYLVGFPLSGSPAPNEGEVSG